MRGNEGIAGHVGRIALRHFMLSSLAYACLLQGRPLLIAVKADAAEASKGPFGRNRMRTSAHHVCAHLPTEAWTNSQRKDPCDMKACRAACTDILPPRYPLPSLSAWQRPRRSSSNLLVSHRGPGRAQRAFVPCENAYIIQSVTDRVRERPSPLRPVSSDSTALGNSRKTGCATGCLEATLSHTQHYACYATVHSQAQASSRASSPVPSQRPRWPPVRTCGGQLIADVS